MEANMVANEIEMVECDYCEEFLAKIDANEIEHFDGTICYRCNHCNEYLWEKHEEYRAEMSY